MRLPRSGFARLLGLTLALTACTHSAQCAAPPEDTSPSPSVPKGEVFQFTFDQSKIFPGATRDVWVYVPAQYQPETPACLYVNQDGIQFNAPAVFDRLIAAHEMPVTIGVFVMHGRVKAPEGSAALDRFNRSYEYDGLGDNYVRFLLDELLPEVETKKTSDGRAIRLSKNGNDHAIGGTSSGAIAAFTAAWERPDAFRRVFSGIGTYVGLRGGDRYPTLIRKYEPKPLRVFLQDGSSDQNIYAGDWWMANQMMERALTFAGYEVQHVWGEGGHNNTQATEVFPDAMRWLWKDWPQPVPAGTSKNGMLTEILTPGENWMTVTEGLKAVGGLTSDANGEVYFNDVKQHRSYRMGEGGLVEEDALSLKSEGGQAFGPDGSLYALSGSSVLQYESGPKGRQKVVAKGIKGNALAVAHNGNIYITQADKAGSGQVWLVQPDGKKQVVDTGLQSPGGVTLSPDQTLLYVSDRPTHWIYSYQIQPDGTLKYKQPYYWLHVPDTSEESGAGEMAVDRDGRLYVATRMGVQVCDQAGRVNAILPAPNNQPVTGIAFGGREFGTLFIASGDRVYMRKLKVRGAPSFQGPTKPEPPRL